ncbi:SAM-dependent chlorinase/fluorinase [soil metagenome]
MPIITLTTDFGARDGYVGALKGVIASNAPNAQIIDIAHDIPRGDIAHAAWVLSTSCREFPHGTIHVCVVDPGVGGDRREVVALGDGQIYVGPDNGVFSYVHAPHWEAYAIEDFEYRAQHVSKTFHGRDVFAVAAARIASGGSPRRAGSEVRLTGALQWGARTRNVGRIVHIDHFGNLISDMPPLEAGKAVSIAGHKIPIVGTYEDVKEGELLAYVGSAKTIEIAVRDGRADERLGVERGTQVIPGASAVPYR